MNYKILLIYIISISWNISFSQNQFQFTIGGTNDELTRSIIKANDNEYVFAGETKSFGAGLSDMYIVKFTSSGSLSWMFAVGGTGNDVSMSVIQTSDGGFALAGYTNSFGAGDYDFYIVKLNSSGSIQWSKTIGGTGTEYAYSIKQTNDGGFIAAGFTYTYGAGDADAFFVKLDGNGNIQWSKTVGRSFEDQAYSVVVTSDGGFAATGESHFGGGNADMYLIKLDANGNLQWTRTVGGPNNDRAWNIIQSSDGGYGIAGWGNSYGSGDYDMYCAKFDVNGSLQWTRTLGGANAESASSIIQTTDGGFLISGGSNSFSGNNDNIYIAKIDAIGVYSWSRIIGGANYEESTSMINTPNNGFLIGGCTSSFGSGGKDMFAVKFDSSGYTCANMILPPTNSGIGGILSNPTSSLSSPTPTISTPPTQIVSGGTLTQLCLVGLEMVDIEIPQDFHLYQNFPNPFNPETNIIFSIPKEGNVNIRIFNLSGKEVTILFKGNCKAGTYKVKWKPEQFPSGVYFYKLETSNYSETKKMLLIK
ncbi:MAG: T9SS type A sorting domain-containing protein [Flavobacteriales bacterium]|nr:T9SS type A sorting domain-containing protein [Flavobacteriales bacterium]